LISVIILTFNSIRFIRTCLDSVFAQDHRDIEVIVVDNGSTDGTVGFIEKSYPQVMLIKNKNNKGACKARNQGIAVAAGKFVLTLDCDVALEKDFISHVKKTIDRSEGRIGMVAPKILNDDKKSIYSAGIYLSKARKFYDIGKGQLDNGQFSRENHVFGPCSAAALYRREMLEGIAVDGEYFDEAFFFLVEDVDIAWRAQRKGWKAVFCPMAVCCHHGNSSKTDKKLRQYLCFRNRYYSMIKNKDLPGYSRNIIYLLVYDAPRLLYLILTNPYTFKAIKEIGRFLSDNSSQGHKKCYSSNLS